MNAASFAPMPPRPGLPKTALLLSGLLHAGVLALLVQADPAPSPPEVLRVELWSPAGASADRGDVPAPSETSARATEKPALRPKRADAAPASAERSPSRKASPPNVVRNEDAPTSVPSAPAMPTPAREASDGGRSERAARREEGRKEGRAAANSGGSETAVAFATAEGAGLVAARFDAAYLNNPPPVYPPVARRRGEAGTVRLRVAVSAEGLPDAVSLQLGSGSHWLDRAAQEAVRRWRFVPARRDGTAVASTIIVPIVFRLED